MARKALCMIIIAVLAVASLAIGTGAAAPREKFELEGKVEATSASSVTVLVKAGSKTIRNLKGTQVDVEVTNRTGFRYKGNRITLNDVRTGDKVHIRGRMQKIGAVPSLLTATRVRVKPRKTQARLLRTD